jgi:hypothetical protein
MENEKPEGMVSVDDMPMDNETKRETFVRLLNYRLEKASRRIRQIGNLSVKSNYDYTEDDVEFIRAALMTELDDMLGRFNQNNGEKTFAKLES